MRRMELRDESIDISLVLPAYNEEESLPRLFEALTALLERLGGIAEVVLVDDGSTDATYAMLLEQHRRDPRFKVIQLSRNFGHQVAISAGLDHAAGRAVIVMDSDLQDPPEVVLEMVARWREGFEVVHGVRISRPGESWFKRASAAAFYRVLRQLTAVDIVANAGDFRLLDRRAADALKSLRERNRFVRGLSSWIGFRQAVVRYDRPNRAAGETKYPLRKMLALATDAIVSFSDAPLYVSLAIGFGVSALAFIAGIVYIVLKLVGYKNLVPGWASIVVILSFLGGMQILLTGMMGLYVARIHDEVKARPLYIVRELHGVGGGPARATERTASPPLAAAGTMAGVGARRES